MPAEHDDGVEDVGRDEVAHHHPELVGQRRTGEAAARVPEHVAHGVLPQLEHAPVAHLAPPDRLDTARGAVVDGRLPRTAGGGGGARSEWGAVVEGKGSTAIVTYADIS